MEKNVNQKKDNSLIVLVFVLIALLFILVVFVTNNGMNTPQGVGVAFALFFMIIIGLVKITKLQSSMKTGRVVDSKEPPSVLESDSGNKITPATINPEAENPVISQVDSIVRTPRPDWKVNLSNWLAKIPKPKRIKLIVGSVFAFIVLIITISWAIGTIDAASPVGTWTQVGYEDRVMYYIYADGTYEWTDYGVVERSGTWDQRGNKIDLNLLYDYGTVYEEGYETAHYVISGDTMTSGGVVLTRLSD